MTITSFADMMTFSELKTLPPISNGKMHRKKMPVEMNL